MGNKTSKEEKKEEPILHRPQQAQASDLYWACQAGDLDFVRGLIALNPSTDLNRLEPNGSTALHEASHFGHAETVRLLLHQHGVVRHRRNRHGLTAYEESASDEIRQLFHRSANSQRFSSDNTNEAEPLFTWSDDQEAEDDVQDNDWVEAHYGKNDIRHTQVVTNIAKQRSAPGILRPFVKVMLSYRAKPDFVYNENTAAEALQHLIDEQVTPSNSEYKKACELVSEYVKSKNVEHLLRLYSLETPFYKNLAPREESGCLLFPLWFKLDSLKNRAYQGRTFRGLTMTSTDLRTYRWAMKLKEIILSTDSFCSTSIDENVARCFMGPSSSTSIAVLMVFNFVEKCDTAIQLFRLSDTLPSISDFEDEREVLILPMTLFHVTDIKINEVTGQHTIYLDNLPTKGGRLSCPKYLWSGLKSRERFMNCSFGASDKQKNSALSIWRESAEIDSCHCTQKRTPSEKSKRGFNRVLGNFRKPKAKAMVIVNLRRPAWNEKKTLDAPQGIAVGFQTAQFIPFKMPPCRIKLYYMMIVTAEHISLDKTRKFIFSTKQQWCLFDWADFPCECGELGLFIK